MSKTKIQWADEVWNPVVGCSVASPGCKNCYAVSQAHMRASNPKMPWYAGTTAKTAGTVHWSARVNVAPDHILLAPLRWKKPRLIFVNSMSDLFHENVSDETIDRVFAIMALCPQHIFMVLTKRAGRMRRYVEMAMQRSPIWVNGIPEKGCMTQVPYEGGWPTNVWLGVSVEDQRRAEERIPELLYTPAAVRWISAEPLLGPLDLKNFHREVQLIDHQPFQVVGDHLDWVVVGGESGSKARPMHPDWARGLRDQCAAAGVPFFFKQWGEWLPWEPEHGPCWVSQNGASEDSHVLFPSDFDNDSRWDDGLAFISEGLSQAAFQRTGKKVSGNTLDNTLHINWPCPDHPAVKAKMEAMP